VDVDADLIAGFADGAFEQVTNTELTAKVRRIFIRSFYRGDGRVRGDVDALNFGELGGDFVGHAVAEVGAVGIGAEISQREDGDGRLGTDGGSGMIGMRFIPMRACDCEEQQDDRGTRVEGPAFRWRGRTGGIVEVLLRDGGSRG